MIIPPINNEDLQGSFDTATLENIPHFFVDFPTWENTKPTLTNTVTDAPVFNGSTPLNCIIDLDPTIKKLKAKYTGQLGHVEAARPVELQPNGEDTAKLQRMPHPFSSTNHIDPNVTKGDKDKLGAKVKDLKNELERLGELDGELNKVSYDLLPTLERAAGLLPDDPKGMQRLKLNFEWVLCQITTLFGQINLALDDNNKNEYNNARDRYIALMRDLDNHEPLLRNAVPGKLGYGRNVKWVYFYPLIHEGKIKGVKVVAKWNPHISSSGIAIPHS